MSRVPVVLQEGIITKLMTVFVHLCFWMYAILLEDLTDPSTLVQYKLHAIRQ
jgi:G:T-mismatch repair DNA endonuclease (very short patch repair protein)